MMVVDLMHEFELGVWKMLFTHLIRILHAASNRPGALVDILNTRYAELTTAEGNVLKLRAQILPGSRIWPVYNTALSQQCLGDEETCGLRFRGHFTSRCLVLLNRFLGLLIQRHSGVECSIPVFEGLLPEPFNGMVLRLLYKAAEWHALAKLRLHTDSTLDLLEAVTREFGRLMRKFRDKTSDEFDTTELPREASARNGGARSSKKKKLNLNTYKFHALGDYVATIRLFRTTDSYSTQLVSNIFWIAATNIETWPLTGGTRPPSCQATLWANK